MNTDKQGLKNNTLMFLEIRVYPCSSAAIDPVSSPPAGNAGTGGWPAYLAGVACNMFVSGA